MTEVPTDDYVQWSSPYLLRGFGQDVIAIHESTSEQSGLTVSPSSAARMVQNHST
jgi:hypothetical protein